ncbi:hypothetical protein CH76_00030 [Lysinibacillus sp. BF-4]|uniref:DUF3397 family protein n=1 Tax=Lysinibacillus sp. BF-4 TaxID=1473546 RepID=UPI0005050D67|nr:DUF3397 family protein [Lysinibacillus sp. BF-4]KFL44237.1 hypothetical protein CH76_00030 [Lysinibacillus sp. BF-4]
MSILQVILSALLFLPHSIFIVLVVLSKKVKFITVGRAADITTVFLMVSVPLALQALTGVQLGYALFSLLIIIAIYNTFRVWRSEKDIEIIKLMRKTWRIYFVILTVLYFLTLLVGMFYHSTSN